MSERKLVTYQEYLKQKEKRNKKHVGIPFIGSSLNYYCLGQYAPYSDFVSMNNAFIALNSIIMETNCGFDKKTKQVLVRNWMSKSKLIKPKYKQRSFYVCKWTETELCGLKVNDTAGIWDCDRSWYNGYFGARVTDFKLGPTEKFNKVSVQIIHQWPNIKRMNFKYFINILNI